MSSQRGSIIKRGETYTAYWRVGDRQRTKGGFHSKADAQRHLNTVLSSMDRGQYLEPSKTTVTQWAATWLVAIKPRVREQTWAQYETLIRTQINPRLGTVPVCKITKAHIQKLASELLLGGRVRGGGPLSKTTVNTILAVLRQMLADAVEWGEVGLAVNPAAGATKLVRPAKRPPTYWSADQVRTFLEHQRQENNRLLGLWEIALATGMRRGELMGLRWADHVQLDTDPHIVISETIGTVAYRPVIGPPKSSSGVRRVPIDRNAVAAFRAHRTRQLQERLAAGPVYTDTGYVFTDETGAPLNPDLAAAAFKRAVQRSGLPMIRFHDMRHTHATLGLSAGVPMKVMSKRLGHSNVAITADLYTHVTEEMDQDAADRVARLIYGTEIQ